MIVGSLDYVLASWQMKEASGDAGGLVYPFIPLLKTLIPLTGLMLFTQGFSNACSSLFKLKHD
jgi:TRAP-type mannitol/chloroaromatic compound transport system permease small subunit